VHGDLKDEAVLESLDLKRVEDRGKVIRVKLDLIVSKNSHTNPTLVVSY